MDRESLPIVLPQVAAFIFLCMDMTYDLVKGVPYAHVIVEACCTIMMAFVIFRSLHGYFKRVRTRSIQIQQERDSFRDQAETWKAEAGHYLKGLVAKIDDQFNAWGLSKAEKEVALLLIKGYSIKEIASLRDTSEKTIKQQNFSIYKKSQLPGRSELAAFFLEDLLLPGGDR